MEKALLWVSLILGITGLFGNLFAISKVVVLIPERLKRAREKLDELESKIKEIEKERAGDHTQIAVLISMIEGVKKDLERILEQK